MDLLSTGAEPLAGIQGPCRQKGRLVGAGWYGTKKPGPLPAGSPDLSAPKQAELGDPRTP